MPAGARSGAVSRFHRALAAAMREFGITGPARAAMFLAQVAHESGELARLEESLWYSTPERIRAVWPSRFPTVDDAKPFVADPKALAEKVYGRRADLGNTHLGDGYRYRGRGPLQITGRAMYARCSVALFGQDTDLLRVPEMLCEPRTGSRSAAWVWAVEKQLNSTADQNTEEAFAWTTRRINGGLNGQADRLAYWRRARACFAL